MFLNSWQATRQPPLSRQAGQFLVFQLDPGADRMREVLQKVRDQALVNPASGAQATLSKVQHVVRRTGDRIHELVRPLLASPSSRWAR